MLKTVLVVWLWTSAGWVQGEHLDGWGPRDYGTVEMCERRRLYIDKTGGQYIRAECVAKDSKPS